MSKKIKLGFSSVKVSFKNIVKSYNKYLESFILIILVTSCAHLKDNIVEYKTLLPDPSNLPCCWQTTEQLEIKLKSKETSLSLVTAISGNQLVVVIFDSFGRKLLNISQTGRQVRVEKEIEMPEELATDWLLLGIFLRDMPEIGWSFKESDWLVKRNGNKKILNQADRAVITLTEEPFPKDTFLENVPDNRLISNLIYHDLDLNVKLTRLNKQRL